jgi:hypothetical protein
VTTLLTSTDRLTLRIDADTLADGYHELGTVMIGRAVALGAEYGWGRAEDVATTVSVRDLRGGGRRARQTAPNRRAVEIDWAGGVDEHGKYTVTSPDHVSIYTGGAGHGDIMGTLPAIAGMLAETRGSERPVVLCLRAPTQGSAPTATAPIRILDPGALLYGRVVTDTWRRDNVLGEEYADPGEVMRGGVLRVEEEL